MFPKSFKTKFNLYLFLGLAIGFFSLFLYLSLSGHLGFKTQINDLGNMAQPLWNSIHGNFMEMSNTPGLPVERMSRFAGHTNFIFLFLIPLYWLWSDPVLLLIIQVLMAALAGIPLFLLGQKFFGPKSYFALIGPLVYYLNPMLHDAVLYDMHAVVLALPFLVFAIYFLENKNYKWFWISAILLMLCKEDMPLFVAMMGIWHGIRTGDYKKAVQITSVGFITFGILVGLIMPYFRESNTQSLISERYAHLGGSIPSIIFTSILKPHLVISDLLSKGVINYLFLVLLGFGFVPLLASVSIVTLPSLAINLLSANFITYQPFGYYYLGTTVALLSVAVLYVLKNELIDKKLGFSKNHIAIFILLTSLGFSWYFSPAPYSRVSSLAEFYVHPRYSQIKDIKKLIPTEASLSVQNNLGAHFINRTDIVQFPYRAEISDFVLIDVTDPYLIVRDQPRQRNFIHIVQMLPQEYYDSAIAILDNPNYGVVYAGDGFILFEKGASRDLNTAGYQTLRQRAEIYFSKYQPYSPTKFYEPEFLSN